MPLFICSKCKNVENTALCGYWYRKSEPLCSKCDPEFGKWHGIFKEEKYDPKEYKLVDGFLQNIK